MSYRMMIRVVRNVQRSRPPWVAINETNRIQYGNPGLLTTMPFGRGPEDVTLHYFKPDRKIHDAEELAAEFESLDLMPDLQAQIADNEQNPFFADKYKNYMQWNVDGKVATHLLFRKPRHWYRTIECRRGGFGLPTGYWLAGVRIHPPSPKQFETFGPREAAFY